MKRTIYLWLTGIVLAGIAVPPASAQSTTTPQTSVAQDTPLGDYARTVRNNKKQQNAKQFDNDNLPKDDKLSVVGAGATGATAPASSNAVASTPDSSTDESSAQADNKAPDKPEVKPGQSQDERQQVYGEWQQRLTDKKAQVDLLSRELDVTQREYKLREAAMYGDAGERFRNQAAWDKENAEYKQKIADKQKALDEAKSSLGDMDEDARKAGVPSSVREAAQQPQDQASGPSQPPAAEQAQPASPESK